MFNFIENGSITSVKGILSAGIHAGLKRKRKDLALILSEQPCNAAGTFTLNKVKAAPIIISKKMIDNKESVKAILINSGNANACTGEKGFEDALETQKYCADKLGLKQSEVLISSTGVIGEYLPVDIVKKGVKKIIENLTEDGGLAAAEAIMTTDLKIKSFALKIKLSKGEITLGGICKGSGMIMPNMATMLAFIATDADIDQPILQQLLSQTVNNSFNKISVDGETSTNDMVILLSNGISKIKIEEHSEDIKIFQEALLSITQKMAKSIVADGEGATKLITVEVKNAKTERDADTIAKTIANSPLVKTAINGSDANWGRILSAAGSSGVEFAPEKVEIKFDDMSILKKNYNTKFCEIEAKQILSKDELTISIELNEGEHNTTWWTCDFSEKYVQINSSYRS